MNQWELSGLAAHRVIVDLVPRHPSGARLADLLALDLKRPDLVAADARRDREAAARIRRVLLCDAMRMVFQPIFDLASMRVVGYEALARIAGPPARSPDRWFAEAASVGMGQILEMTAVRAALASFDVIPAGTYLSINVSPDLLATPVLAEALSEAPADRVVLEITEHARVQSYPALKAAIGPLRATGVRLAVDDVGAGFASLHHIVALRPEVVKLDIGLIQGIDVDPARRSLAVALTRFATDVGASLTAEGIERPEELSALREAGVPFGQGFHLAPPGPLRGTGRVA